MTLDRLFFIRFLCLVLLVLGSGEVVGQGGQMRLKTSGLQGPLEINNEDNKQVGRSTQKSKYVEFESHKLYNQHFTLLLYNSYYQQEAVIPISFFGKDVSIEFEKNQIKSYQFTGLLIDKRGKIITDIKEVFLKNTENNQDTVIKVIKGRYKLKVYDIKQIRKFVVQKTSSLSYSLVSDTIRPNGSIVLTKQKDYHGTIYGQNDKLIQNARIIFKTDTSNKSDVQGKFKIGSPKVQFISNKHTLLNVQVPIPNTNRNLTIQNIPYRQGNIGNTNFYWVNKGLNIKVIIPYTSTLQKYLATESGQIIRNTNIELINIDYKFKTDANGVFYTNLLPSLVKPKRLDIIKINHIPAIDTTKVLAQNDSNTPEQNNPQISRYNFNDIEKLDKQGDDIISKIEIYTNKVKNGERLNPEELVSLKKEIQDYRKEVETLRNKSIYQVVSQAVNGNQELIDKLLPKDKVINDSIFNNLLGKLSSLSEESVKSIRKEQKQVHILYQVIIGIALLSLLASLWYIYKIRRKNRQLESHNTLIDLLIGELQHRVVNGLLAVRSLVSTISDDIDHPPTQVHLQEADDFIQRLINLHDILDYNFITDTKGEVMDAEEMHFTLTNISDTIINFYFNNTEALKPKVNIEIKVGYLTKDQFSFIGFSVYELVNNACKHAFRSQKTNKHPAIHIEILSRQKATILIISDNGQGIPTELFRDGVINTEQIYSSKGLKITQHLTKIFQGEFKVYTAEVHANINAGSTIECEFKF